MLNYSPGRKTEVLSSRIGECYRLQIILDFSIFKISFYYCCNVDAVKLDQLTANLNSSKPI